ncbi:MAG TPA: lipocalin-like domain-containing protein [Gemmatimonadaceae bacterium]|nr:lipocalin-like domain-containing protein [Gemmatimonadaceae bacterium]
MRRRLPAVLLLAVAAACSTSRAAAPWVGTWRMAAVESRDSASGPWRRPFGDAPSGYVIYGADGSHAMNFTRTPVAPMFAASSDRGATEAELRQAYEGYFSWFGRYTVDPARSVIIHRIEGSLWPSWRNTVQERPFVIRGDTMLLGDLVRARRVLVRVR